MDDTYYGLRRIRRADASNLGQGGVEARRGRPRVHLPELKPVRGYGLWQDLGLSSAGPVH
jgi:hypothetical protein